MAQDKGDDVKDGLLIGANLIMKPRKIYYCDDCHKSINGAYISLFGSAHGDNPYRIKLHPKCCRSKDDRVVALQSKLKVSINEVKNGKI